VAGSALLANQLLRTDPWLLGGRQRARLSIVTLVGGECDSLNPRTSSVLVNSSFPYPRSQRPSSIHPAKPATNLEEQNADRRAPKTATAHGGCDRDLG